MFINKHCPYPHTYTYYRYNRQRCAALVKKRTVIGARRIAKERRVKYLYSLYMRTLSTPCVRSPLTSPTSTSSIKRPFHRRRITRILVHAQTYIFVYNKSTQDRRRRPRHSLSPLSGRNLPFSKSVPPQEQKREREREREEEKRVKKEAQEFGCNDGSERASEQGSRRRGGKSLEV